MAIMELVTNGTNPAPSGYIYKLVSVLSQHVANTGNTTLGESACYLLWSRAFKEITKPVL